MQEVKEEGIWPLAYRPEPCQDPKWESAVQDFLRRLDAVQDGALRHRLKGCVRCRICGQPAEAYNIRVDNWVWPAGLRHYIQVHNFRPSQEFIELIVTKTDSLPLTKQEKEAYTMTTAKTNSKTTSKTASKMTARKSAKKAPAKKPVAKKAPAKKAPAKKVNTPAVSNDAVLQNAIAGAGFAGFFRAKEDMISPLPWPVTDKLVGWTKPVQSRFCQRLAKVEESAEQVKQRGVFKNVLTGAKLGNIIFKKDGMQWTTAVGVMVAEQSVQVPTAFLKFIVGATEEDMPLNASEKKFYGSK